MGNRDWNKEKVLVFDRDRHVDSIRRIVFSGGFRATHPHAAGFVNYEGAIAVLHRNPDGILFLDRSEPLIRGYRPLTANWN
jgi:hypothetical protein